MTFLTRLGWHLAAAVVVAAFAFAAFQGCSLYAPERVHPQEMQP